MVKNKWKITCQECNKEFEHTESYPKFISINSYKPIYCPNCDKKLAWGVKVKFLGKFLEQSEEKRQDIISNIIQYCDNNNLYINYYTGIAEIGYDDKPMICANWNDKKLEKIYNYLDRKMNDLIEVDWYDEWTHCTVCYKAVRTSADSHMWERSYLRTGYDDICHNCINEEPEILIEELINKKDRASLSWGIPIIQKAGFVCLEDLKYKGCQIFETGFHAHQTDDPRKVIRDLEKEFGVSNLEDIYDWIFAINSVGQFDIHWSIFLREKEK